MTAREEDILTSRALIKKGTVITNLLQSCVVDKRVDVQKMLSGDRNAVMVALVDHASEPIWLDAYNPPTTDAGWREAEHHAYQAAISGKTIQLAGTGPNDADWVADSEWIRMADEMSNAGMDALSAVKARNIDQLTAAGDRLVASCNACHVAFKPDLPSMGIYKSPDYPAAPPQ
jgi:hypothetical protein